jgi:hypothetical protein
MPMSRCRPPGRSPSPFSLLIKGLGDLDGGGAGLGGGTRCLVVQLGGAVVCPVDLVQAPGGVPMRPAGPVGPSGGSLRPGGRGLAPRTSAHQGACGAAGGSTRGATPVLAPLSSVPSALGSVEHLPGAMQEVLDGHRDPSRSPQGSRITLTGPHLPPPGGLRPPSSCPGGWISVPDIPAAALQPP